MFFLCFEGGSIKGSFFFFQAEDGIRDHCVTGVQTCALPISLVGDGAMQMNGINELITIAKYWRRWSDPRLVVLVLNNRDLNQVTWEQRALEGDPKYEASQDIPDFPYARYAELVGLKGIRISDPGDVGAAWDEA